MRRFGHVVVVIAILGTLGHGGQAHAGSPTPQLGRTTSTGIRSVAAVGTPAAGAISDCPASNPRSYDLVDTRGHLVAGIHECGGLGQTLIRNTSKSTVWFINLPTLSHYWTPEQDSHQSLTVQLFRAGLRVSVSPKTPKITVEPGTSVRIRAWPAGIQLQQVPSQQAAWQASALVVSQFEKKLKASAVKLLTKNSLARSAVVTCVQSGYAAAKALAATTDDLADQLATALGLRGNVARCSSAIDRAARADAHPSQAVTAGELARTTRSASWERRVEPILEQALRRLRISRVP